MPPPVTNPSPLVLAGLVAPVAVAQWGLVLWAWHAALARAMRARGLARWTVADTVLVSPLFAGGTLMAVAALDWALARATLQLAGAGTLAGAPVGAALALAAAAVVVSAFGVRAVGKLY